MSKGRQRDETKNYDKLLEELGPVCMPAKNFISWQKQLKVNKKENKLTSLRSWVKDHKVLTTIMVPNSVGIKTEPLQAYRLDDDARGIVKGIIEFVFDLFNHDIVPQSHISLEDIYVERGINVWVDNIIVKPSNEQLRGQAIENLKGTIRQFVGINEPADLSHLLNNTLEAAKTNVAMEAAVFMHPSLHMNCTMAAFSGYLYRLLKRALDTKDNVVESQFDTIAFYMTLVQPNWDQRIYSDARGTDWPTFLTDTSTNHMDGLEQIKLRSPLGPLILMRHAMIHYQRKIDRGPLSIDLANLENQFYVLFPTYMSEFVHHMVLLKLFKDHWMK